MFSSFISNIPILRNLGGGKSDKEFAAAAPQSAQGSVPPEAPASAVTSPLESLSQATADSLNAMNDGFDAVLKSMRASNRITEVDEKVLRSQLNCAVAHAFEASTRVTMLRRNSAMAGLQFAMPGPAGRGQSASAGLEDQQLAMMKATAHAAATLDGMAANWRSLPAAADPEFQSALGNAKWHLQALGRNLLANALAQAVPKSHSLLTGDELHPSTATIRAMVFNSGSLVPVALRGYVARMTTNIAHAVSDPALVCLPVDEATGIPPGHYPLPEGEPIGREFDDWKEDAVHTFIKDFKRDTVGGGAMTIDGREVVPRAALDAIRGTSEVVQGGADPSEQSTSSSSGLSPADALAHAAVAEIRAAVPPNLLDTVVGVVSQRSPLELNARFAGSALDAASAALDGSQSGKQNFAIRTQASHGRPGVVEVQVSKMCAINGVVYRDGSAAVFDTPAQVTLSGTFEVTAERIIVKSTTAEVHRQGQS